RRVAVIGERKPVAYSLQIGIRYLRSKKRRTVSVITFIAIAGVALGVASLLAVLSITSGFQQEFRDKILGVNAHVLVMKYGVDFSEYRDVIDRARAMPEVAGAGPFLINEMMLAKDDRLSGVLVKGVDPVAVGEVLELPRQIIDGSLEGLRASGAEPAQRSGEEARDAGNTWQWLEDLEDAPAEETPAPEETPGASAGDVREVETLSPEDINAMFG